MKKEKVILCTATSTATKMLREFAVVYSVLTGYARSGRNPPLPPGTSRKLTAGRHFQCCRYLQKFGHSIHSTRRSRTRAAQSLDNPSHRRQSGNCNQGSLLHRLVADVFEQKTPCSSSSSSSSSSSPSSLS